MMRPLLCLLGVATTAAAQTPAPPARRDTIAFAGTAGVYVWTGGTIVSPEHPVNGVVAHRVERRRAGDGTATWTPVADVSAVATANDFFRRLDRGTRASVVQALRQPDEAAAWAFIVRFPRADSLARIISDERVRLALGVYALDDRVRAGEAFEYRVTHVDARGALTGPAAVVSTVVPFPAVARFAPVRVLRVESTESTAVIWWHVQTAGGLPARTLEIWRRRGRSGAFARVDSVLSMVRVGDTVFARHEAHGLAATQTYEFYAVPRDVFFNFGTATDTATVYTVSPIAFFLPDSLKATSVDTVGLVVTWRFANPRMARNIRVYRSPAQDTGWRQIAELPAGARRFVDPQAPEMRMSYYRLTVTGPRNEESPPTAATFGFYRSLAPPPPPYGIVAEAGPGGRGVRLTWQRGRSDLRGYYVFRSPAAIDSIRPDSPLEQISPLLERDTTFVDTVSAVAPGREYAFVVQAVSRSEVRSPYSEPAFFAPPERGGLPAPTGLRGFVEGDRVRLFWDDMTAVEFSVSGYVVERRLVGRAGGSDSAFTAVTAVPLGRPENTFIDSNVTAGRVYEYVARSVDRTRAQSARSLPARVPVPLVRPVAPAGLRALPTATGIEVAWSEIEGLTATVRIYRYERGGRPARLTEVAATTTTFLDRTAQPGRRYYYHATLVVAGVESAPSAEVTARR